MATRDRPTSAAPAAGGTTLDTYDALFEHLFDNSVLPLTNVGGTANAVTADVDPELPASGLSAGMKFTLIWAAANTSSGVTLSIGGEPALDVVDADGSALEVGQLAAGHRDIVEVSGGEFRLLTRGVQAPTGPSAPQTFNSSGTWTNNFESWRIVMVELWGAGDAGGAAAGGDGGEFNRAFFRAGDLGATETVGVGSGGTAPGGAGTDTVFGSHLTARAGRSQNPASDWSGSDGGASGDPGEPAYWGGAGGAGTGSTGGTSQYGGDGGDSGNPGAQPGGGGGANANGGDGRAKITVF